LLNRYHLPSVALLAACAFATCGGQQPVATSGTFVLHKFGKAIGKESYSIENKGDSYTLSSHFLFTDRGSPVPLETTFVARTTDMRPWTFAAKGRSSRLSAMDDAVTVKEDRILMTRTGQTESQSASGAWFIVDGYSPAAMQEQMMRWWLMHSRPAVFTVYPSKAKVTIKPYGLLNIGGQVAHGYTVGGLIWGEESLWMDDGGNLLALVSTDAEFDHFEAVRENDVSGLGTFIAAAVQADLAVLAELSATARMASVRELAITGATLEDSTGAAAVENSVILIENGVITAAGTRAQVHIPKSATILDAAGKYAIPGLWDMHAHYEQVEWGPIYLAAGVTSVRDVGNEFDFIRTIHSELDRKQNPAIGPHLEFAGIIDGTGASSLGAVLADTPEQALMWVERYKAAGARQIKIYSSVKPDIVRAITENAHARGLTVTGHVPNEMTAIDAVNAGMDQINHIQYLLPYFSHPVLGADGKPDRTEAPVLEADGPRAKELIASLKAHHTIVDPTLALFEMYLHTKPLDQLEPGLNHVAPQLREALDSPPAPAPKPH